MNARELIKSRISIVKPTAAGLLLVLVAACSQGSVAHSNQASAATSSRQSPTSPAPSPANPTDCAADRPAPTFGPNMPSTRQLALVNLRGSEGFVVRDVTDVNHPLTVSNLGNSVGYTAQFVSSGEVSDVTETGLIRMAVSGAPVTLIARCGGTPFAWSSDGKTTAYMEHDAGSNVDRLHIVANGVDRRVADAPSMPAIGCESRACADFWDFRMLFSPGGQYISLVEQPFGMTSIWTVDGTLVKSLDGPATMSVWSGNSLYWRDDKGVEVWRNGTQKLMLPVVSWIRPHASPSGSQIVYETRDANSSTAHVFLLDTATGTTRQLASSRSEPTFLTSRYVWYQGERPCQPTDPCPVAPTIQTGTTYLYDLQTGKEYQSIITRVYDIWPHAA